MTTSKQALSGQSSASSDGHHETVAILAESAIPTLYTRNGFRILDLPADATAREISRRKQTVEKALNHNVTLPPGPGRYFPLTPPADQAAVREAMQRLSDPERRLIDELFWFWPHRQGQAASDPALSHLREGKHKEAEGFWLEQEAEQSESSISTHNLALLYHFRALEKEMELLRAAPDSIQVNGVAKVWDKCFRRWRSLSEQDGFWGRLTSRIRELEDPRLTAGTARRIRGALPAALLSICGQLVLQAVEAGRKESASRLVETINKSGFCETDIKEGLRMAIEPVRNRVKVLCKAAELASENDPAHADKVCSQLLSSAKPLLDGLDCLLLANHPTREVAHDDVAERALRCQVAFAKKTENWTLSVTLLESALPIAANESVRKQIQENIEIVRKHADTNDDFCGEGYYDAPAPLIEQMEKVRAMANGQNFDQAVQCLEALLAGKTEVQISKEHVGLVKEALAYCLGCRAAKRVNEALKEWNDFDTSVIKAIQGRVEQISDTSWRCAAMETIPQYTSCPCMACGTVISSRYMVMKWTFNKEKGPATLIICGSCSERHRSQLATVRTKLKEAVRQSAQDFADAGQLDPANKFVQGQIEQIRKMCSDVEIPMPPPQRSKIKTAKSESTATAAAPTKKKKWWEFWK